MAVHTQPGPGKASPAPAEANLRPTFLNRVGDFFSNQVKNLAHLLPPLAASTAAVSALVAPRAAASAFDTILPAGFPGSDGSWNLPVFSLYTGFGCSGAPPGLVAGFSGVAPGLRRSRSGISGIPRGLFPPLVPSFNKIFCSRAFV